jgi:hypothetical protein
MAFGHRGHAGKGKCKYGRKKTGRHGCLKHPRKKKHRRSRR